MKLASGGMFGLCWNLNKKELEFSILPLTLILRYLFHHKIVYCLPKKVKWMEFEHLFDKSKNKSFSNRRFLEKNYHTMTEWNSNFICILIFLQRENIIQKFYRKNSVKCKDMVTIGIKYQITDLWLGHQLIYRKFLRVVVVG